MGIAIRMAYAASNLLIGEVSCSFPHDLRLNCRNLLLPRSSWLGLAVLITFGKPPSPVLTALGLITLGATLTTIDRFSKSPALPFVLVAHTLTYGCLAAHSLRHIIAFRQSPRAISCDRYHLRYCADHRRRPARHGRFEDETPACLAKPTRSRQSPSGLSPSPSTRIVPLLAIIPKGCQPLAGG